MQTNVLWDPNLVSNSRKQNEEQSESGELWDSIPEVVSKRLCCRPTLRQEAMVGKRSQGHLVMLKRREIALFIEIDPMVGLRP